MRGLDVLDISMLIIDRPYLFNVSGEKKKKLFVCLSAQKETLEPQEVYWGRSGLGAGAGPGGQRAAGAQGAGTGPVGCPTPPRQVPLCSRSHPFSYLCLSYIQPYSS